MFDYTSITPDSVTSDLEAAIGGADALLDELVGVEGPRTMENTGEPFLEVSRRMADLYGRGPFLSQAHPDVAVREAARLASERLAEWGIRTQFRRDLYRAFADFAAGLGTDIDPETRRWVDHELRDLRLAGHELDEAARTELEELNQRLAELGIRFQQNLAENADTLDVPVEDLVGLDEAIIAGLADGGAPGTKRVTMRYPDVVPALGGVRKRSVRLALSTMFNNRCVGENRGILEEAIGIRLRIARLFGLPTWAHHRMQTKMADGPEAVFEFYEGLVPALTEKAREELAVLERLLVADGETPPLRRHDLRYYDEQLRRTEYGVDQQAIAAYFPLESTMDGLLDLSAEVFGLGFRVVEDARTWHPDAVLHEVTDAADGRVIGHFFADLFPREGKYGHAAAFPLLPAHEGRDGWVSPVTAFLCNFPRPTADRPSLLRHEDVVTLFHEFGHVLHMTLSRARIPRFSGASTEWDFVEAPSQIMEHWCWSPEILTRISRHHLTGEPIPDGLVTQLTASRDVNRALFALRQVSLGMIDLNYHGVDGIPDLETGLADAEAVGLVLSDDGSFMPATFGHLFGYDAGYYGYLWAEVFGDDMFSVFAEAGLTDPDVGRRYRATILEPNGTKDAVDLLADFLGREPSNEAFLRKLGIG